MNDLVSKIESGEVTWDNVYDQICEESFKQILSSFSNLKNATQSALKVNINSEFGALDNQYFVANNRNISGSITFIGRLLNRLTGDNINRYLKKKFGGGEYIVYADTDSVINTTKLKVKNLFKIKLKNGEIKYVDGNELDRIRQQDG